MTREQHIHELIDQYLSGELIGQDLDKFKIRLKDDPDFLAQVQLQKAIIQNIEKHRNAELKAMLSEKTRRKGFIIPIGTRPLAIAATLLALLAFGLVIKTMLPVNRGDSITQERSDDSDKSVTSKQDKETKQLAESEAEKPASDSINPTPEMELAEDDLLVNNEAFPEAKDSDVIFSEEVVDDDVDISELMKDEEQLDGSRMKPKRDSILGSTTTPLYVVTANAVEILTETSKTPDKEEKNGLFSRKKKSEDEAVSKSSGTDMNDRDAAQTYSKSVAGSITVEFWESVINFKGYRFDGKRILLFDTPPNTPIQLVQYQGVTYLKKNQTFYLIVPNNSFNQLSKVTNEGTLRILNQQ